MRMTARRRQFSFALALTLAAMPAVALHAAQDPAAKSAGAPAKPASRGLAPALFDKKQPIEITSDTLDVDQEAKTAIFQGNVDAIQGQVHLKADRLKVYYEGDADAAGSAGTAAPEPATAQPQAAGGNAAPDATSNGKIKRMDVDGKVFMSSPTETASGDKAVYEAETGMITLTGNVILTRGPNVIRGTKLVIDAQSGHSVIDSKSSVGGGRVKGLFVPKGPAAGEPTAQAQPKPAQ